MKQHTGALLFLLAVAVGFIVWSFLKPDPHSDALELRAMATRKLAQHLAQAHPGKRALVIANPFIQRSGAPKGVVAMEEAGIRGLREGFGSAMGGVEFPELKPEASANPAALLAGIETATPLSYLVTTNAFDDLIRKHPDCELVVSLIGLPAELEYCQAWTSTNALRFALLLPDLKIIGDALAVEESLKSGKLAGFIMQKPRSPGSASGGDGEGNDQFILVTRETFGEVKVNYPGLFPSVRE